MKKFFLPIVVLITLIMSSTAHASDDMILNYQWTSSGDQYALVPVELATKNFGSGFAADLNFVAGAQLAGTSTLPSFGLELASTFTTKEGFFVKLGLFGIVRQERKVDGGLWFGAGWKF